MADVKRYRDSRGRYISEAAWVEQNGKKETKKKQTKSKSTTKRSKRGLGHEDSSRSGDSAFPIGERKPVRDSKGRFTKITLKETERILKRRVSRPIIRTPSKQQTLETGTAPIEKPNTVPKYIREAEPIPLAKRTAGIDTVNSKTGRFTSKNFDRYRVRVRKQVPTGEVYKVNNKKYGIVKGQPKMKYKTFYGEWKDVPKKVAAETDADRLRQIYLLSTQDKIRSSEPITPTHTVKQEYIKTGNVRKYAYIVSGEGHYTSDKEKKKVRKTIRLTSDTLLSYDDILEDFTNMMKGQETAMKRPRKGYNKFALDEDTVIVEMAFEMY